MRILQLHRQALIPAPLEDVFPFFSQASNLEHLTPKSLHFEILTPLPIEMKAGTVIEYRLKLMGIPFRWLTEITAWEPSVRFVDVQRKGPYLLWEHEHLFKATSGGTLMEDNLRYAVPGGFLEPVISGLFVNRQVQRVFDFREEAIASVFK